MQLVSQGIKPEGFERSEPDGTEVPSPGGTSLSLKVPLTFSSMQLFLSVFFIHSNQYLLYSIEKQMQFFGAACLWRL